MKEVKYALRHKKKKELVTYYTTSNEGGDFCGDTTCHLSTGSEKTWYAASPEHAEYVRKYSTRWYNAGYETPNHDFEPGELEVVKVTITVDEEPVKVEIPTVKQYFKMRYGEEGGPSKKDLGHLKHVLKCIDNGEDIAPSWHEMNEVLKYKKMTEHASLECPDCGEMCQPKRNLKNGGASYRCTNSGEHGDHRPLSFKIDGDGEVTW